ncbi:hypothetical protein T12_8949 [Trichinella patagoniensis]|uniref:Uncharacterized protein n=1 Tax=Trichinella patagoniensis TaxID=990121 RepID=A0A0V0ZFG6_9BILA|nr:hypothetical protein T12_8949 [Trichinella patagoniensis]
MPIKCENAKTALPIAGPLLPTKQSDLCRYCAISTLSDGHYNCPRAIMEIEIKKRGPIGGGGGGQLPIDERDH